MTILLVLMAIFEISSSIHLIHLCFIKNTIHFITPTKKRCNNEHYKHIEALVVLHGNSVGGSSDQSATVCTSRVVRPALY